MSPIRVLIADDHDMFREGLKVLLQPYTDIEVVGEASDGRQATDKACQLQPDVVLMDIAMPVMNGLEATRRICRESPQVKVVVLTQYDDREYVLSLVRSGASGYVTKKATASELVSAIRAAYEGNFFLQPSVASTLVQDYLQRLSELRASNSEGGYDRLTDREREVLQLVAEGRSNQEISAILGLSVKTVLRHRTNLMEKLDIHNRTQLIKYAIAQGLIQVPKPLEEK